MSDLVGRLSLAEMVSLLRGAAAYVGLAAPYADRALHQGAGKVVVLQGLPPCVP